MTGFSEKTQKDSETAKRMFQNFKFHRKNKKLSEKNNEKKRKREKKLETKVHREIEKRKKCVRKMKN